MKVGIKMIFKNKHSDYKEKYILEIKKRNPKAMEFVISEYSNLLYKVVYSVLRDYGDEGIIEECLNDIFMSIWENIDKFKGENDKFKSWICAIAKYKAIDYSRKKSKENIKEDLNAFTVRDEEDIEKNFILKEYKKIMINEIKSMKEPDKSIFLKKYFLGYSSKEISKDLNISSGCINTRLSRGRKVLKEKLKYIMEAI